jgi:hypothetical protein
LAALLTAALYGLVALLVIPRGWQTVASAVAVTGLAFLVALMLSMSDARCRNWQQGEEVDLARRMEERRQKRAGADFQRRRGSVTGMVLDAGAWHSADNNVQSHYITGTPLSYVTFWQHSAHHNVHCPLSLVKFIVKCFYQI